MALMIVLPASALAASADPEVLWEYDAGEPITGISVAPSTGHVVFAGKNTGTVFELAPSSPTGATVVWSVPAGLLLPDNVRRLASGHLLAADTQHQKVVELDGAGNVVWSFGTGVRGCSTTQLDTPGDALRLANGDTLIADQGNDRLLQVDSAGSLVWEYGACPLTPQPSVQPYGLDVFPNGDVLVAKVAVNQISRIAPTLPAGGTVVWQYGDGTWGAGSNQLAAPTRAHLLPDGNILVADTDNNRIIAVAPASTGGTVLWQCSTADGQLNAAYDAAQLDDGTILIADSNNQRLIRVIGPNPLRWSIGCDSGGGLNWAVACVLASVTRRRRRRPAADPDPGPAAAAAVAGSASESGR
jgi:hypothetical protein